MPSDPITSASNPRILAAARLRDARQRRDTGLALVDGQREIARAAAAGVEIVEVFVDPAVLTPPPDWLARLESGGTRIVPAQDAAFAKVAFGDRNEGCVAVVRFAGRTLADAALPADRPVLVVEGIEKPGNLGAILRTADAAGLGGVIACGPGTDPANPATIRASLGTVFSVPVATASTEAVIDWCAAHRRRVMAATPTGATLWHAADLTGPVVLLLGSEAHGIAPGWAAAAAAGRLAFDTVRLPMHGAADSLNVAATAAVLAYEALRQEDARPRRSPEDRSR